MTKFLCLFFWAIFITVAGIVGNQGSLIAATVSNSPYPPLDMEKIQTEQPIYRGQNPSLFGTRNNVEDFLLTPPEQPVGTGPNPTMRNEMKAILETSRRESAAQKNAENPVTQTPTPQTPSNNPPNNQGTDSSVTPTVPPTVLPNQNLVAIKLTPGKGDNNFFAELEDGTVLAVKKTPEGYYTKDGRKVIDLGEEQAETSKALVGDVWWIVLFLAATFASVYLGFIAIDYQHRLEQALATQNQRLTGSSGDFSSDSNLWEPETLSFPRSGGSSFDSFDSETSFRTTA